MIDQVRLSNDDRYIFVHVRRNGEWHELIREYVGNIQTAICHQASVSAIWRSDTTCTNKHREQVLDSIRELADWLDPDRIPRRPTHADQTKPLELVAIMGARSPGTDEVSLTVRVRDPRQVLRKGYGCIEGFGHMGDGDYNFDRGEVAEHLSTLFAQDALAFAALVGKE